ncbi:hypothetical protein FALBO_11804 [Fusarium albosuccineum]|uniref:Uncharacterized protein n=1 Tax=Fusarium albosuccineum TaxID=1237068 RepID=A0A8H4PHM3_9HYPO|nr:hypothetical protein FALBO_11804 [Fusarium albosuccineum]
MPRLVDQSNLLRELAPIMLSSNRYAPLLSVGPENPASIFTKYKELGTQIYNLLDPDRTLEHAQFRQANKVARELVDRLPADKRITVSSKLDEAIKLRKKWGERFTRAPLWKQNNHTKYIRFLEGILQQLRSCQDGTTAAVADARESEREADETTDDDEPGLTPAQVDFLTFLDTIVAMTKRAVMLWEEVAQGTLPIWTASICPGPWAANLSRSSSSPQLAKDWANALDKVRGEKTAWCELATIVPLIMPYVVSLLTPFATAPSDLIHWEGDWPYALTMIRSGSEALRKHDHLTSAAQVPLATLIGVYFFVLVTSKYQDGTSKAAYLDTVRNAACSAIDENSALLPRLLISKAINEETRKSLSQRAEQMKQWATNCPDLVSLGSIHRIARIDRVYLHTHTIACDSIPLQVLLYLYEKQRLQDPKNKVGTDDQPLIGSLLKDSRVEPLLLQCGRPQSVSECITALRDWCHVPTSNGETLDPPESGRTSRIPMVERTQQCAAARQGQLWCDKVISDGCAVTSTTYGHLKKWNNGSVDDSTLKDYINWELNPPSCLELESALFKVVGSTPGWNNLRRDAVLRELQEKNQWHTRVLGGTRAALRLRGESPDTSHAFVVKDSMALETAAVEAALKLAGYKASLKKAIVGESLNTRSVAAINYMLPTDDSKIRSKEQKKRAGEIRKQEVQQLLKLFMEEATPALEKAYGQQSHTSTGNTKTTMDQLIL